MKFNALLLLFSIVFFSCSTTESITEYVISEKEGEVLLTDLSGVDCSLVCGIDGKKKKCGIIFVGFASQSIYEEFNYESSKTTITVPGFKDASILSIQMKDENTGKSKSLISYMQEDVPYMKGSDFVPSVMNLKIAKPTSTYVFSGYYDGGKWVDRDTTIATGDTLFANEEGVLDFSIVDRKGNKARLAMDVSKLIEANDASTIRTMGVDDPNTSELYTYHFWDADTGMILFEPLEVNFDFTPPLRTVRPAPVDTLNTPFVRLTQKLWSILYDYNEYVINGGANERKLTVEVVNYAE